MVLAILIIAFMPFHPVAMLQAATQAASTGVADADRRLDPRIAHADPKHYEAVLDRRDWKNPSLDVTDDGFWLQSRSTDRRFVSNGDLRQVLTSLPVGDWPYGRVVVIQQPGIGEGDAMWWSAVRANFFAALDVVKALDAEWFGWPA